MYACRYVFVYLLIYYIHSLFELRINTLNNLYFESFGMLIRFWIRTFVNEDLYFTEVKCATINGKHLVCQL